MNCTKPFDRRDNIKVSPILREKAPVQEFPEALRIAVKLIKMFEGCNLVAYPDPASELYSQFSRRNILRKWMNGDVTEVPKDLQGLSGAPWTIGYGETVGVKLGDVWTQEQADSALEAHAKEFLASAIKSCPKLATEAPERLAACVSLAYNIGSGAFAKSSVAREINEGDWQSAGSAFLLWNKAGGVVMEGLVKRRKIERDVFLSVAV